MTKRMCGISLAAFFFACMLLSGCETAKGAAEGAKKDFKNAKKIDAWMQKNMW